MITKTEIYRQPRPNKTFSNWMYQNVNHNHTGSPKAVGLLVEERDGQGNVIARHIEWLDQGEENG